MREILRGRESKRESENLNFLPPSPSPPLYPRTLCLSTLISLYLSPPSLSLYNYSPSVSPTLPPLFTFLPLSSSLSHPFRFTFLHPSTLSVPSTHRHLIHHLNYLLLHSLSFLLLSFYSSSTSSSSSSSSHFCAFSFNVSVWNITTRLIYTLNHMRVVCVCEGKADLVIYITAVCLLASRSVRCSVCLSVSLSVSLDQGTATFSL